MVDPFLVLSRFVLESVPFGGHAAQQEGGANRHCQGCCSAEMDASSEGFAGGVKELALDSDWWLIGDADRSGESILGSVCLRGEAPKDFKLGLVGAAVPPAAAVAAGIQIWPRP